MKKRIILTVFIISAALLSACGNTKEKDIIENTTNTDSPSEDADTASKEWDNIGNQTIVDDKESSDEENTTGRMELSTIPDEEMLQQLYDKAHEYEYLALGYYQDPENPAMVRDGYVPFDENFVQESTDWLKSTAHGVSIRLYMIQADSASKANKESALIYNETLTARGISAEFQDVLTFDNDTLALSIVLYRNENGEPITAFVYNDIRDDGTVYMCAEIEFNESEFDDTTLALVEEMDDAYSMTFSSMFYD